MNILITRIVHQIGKISESSTGWTKELNLISCNGKEAKYDLRDWHQVFQVWDFWDMKFYMVLL